MRGAGRRESAVIADLSPLREWVRSSALHDPYGSVP